MRTRLQNVFQTISLLDFFAAKINVNYQQSSTKKSIFGGILSLIMFAVIMLTIYTTLVSFASKQHLIVQLHKEINKDSQPLLVNNENFFFVVGIFGFDMIETNRSNFNYQLVKTTIQKGQQPVLQNFKMIRCNLQIFSKLYPDFVLYFQNMDLNSHLCLPQNVNIGISGSKYDNSYQYLSFRIKSCSQNCSQNSQTQQFHHRQLELSVNFYFINKILHVDSPIPVLLYLQDKIFDYMISKYFKQFNLFLSEFQIETDSSLLQFNKKNQLQKGIYFNRKMEKKILPVQTGNEQIFMEYNLIKDNQKVFYKRKFNRFNDLLSYIGGLIGIYLFLLGPFVKKFNQFVLELQISSRLFKEQQNLPNSQHQNNFCHSSIFLSFISYIFIQKFANICPNSYVIQENKNYLKLKQIKNKLSIHTLLSSLTSFDINFKCRLNQFQITLLFLQERLEIINKTEKEEQNNTKVKNKENSVTIKSIQQSQKSVPIIRIKNKQRTQLRKYRKRKNKVGDSINELNNAKTDEISVRILLGVNQQILNHYRWEEREIKQKTKFVKFNKQLSMINLDSEKKSDTDKSDKIDI